MLKGRQIVLGVTGGIAAYKAGELVRELVRAGSEVRVIMTRNAQAFITPLTFQTLSGNPVHTELFSLTEESEIDHISLADRAELLVIAPATANIIGKIAAGIADDLLTSVVLATQAPILLAPAMNVHMWANPICRENLEKLRLRGYHFVDPESGELACGYEGQGRLAEISTIVEEIRTVLSSNDYAGKKVLVTAGPTEESIDPVRFISNRSSGKMGFALARAARRRGADVTLISGPTALAFPRNIRCLSVRSAEDMREKVLENFKEASILIMAAAVADYRPTHPSTEKLKKNKGEIQLLLERNPDILNETGRQKGERILVGFAAETGNLLSNAQSKLLEKNLDLIVANDVTLPGAGFEGDTNIVKLLDPSGKVEELPCLLKEEVADRILDRIAQLRKR